MSVTMNRQWRLACVVLLAALSQSGMASPTSDEFQRCDDMPDASFRYCMASKASPPADESACRIRAQEMKDACLRQLHERYRKPSPAEQAEQGKRQRMMREAQRRADEAASATGSAP